MWSKSTIKTTLQCQLVSFWRFYCKIWTHSLVVSFLILNVHLSAEIRINLKYPISISPENNRKPLVFWPFHGVQRWDIDLKRVKNNYLNLIFKRKPHKMVEQTQTICRQFAGYLNGCIWVCLTILWGWRLKG